MASKRNFKVEAEIDKCRSSKNWERALDITKSQWPKPTSASDVLTSLIRGEKELELYLQENPPDEHNVEKARTSLEGAEKWFRYVISRCPKDREQLKQEAVMLLGKLMFAQARYKEVHDEFANINMEVIKTMTVTNRMLKILAEGLAVKAMCMEKLHAVGEPDISTEAIIKYYEQAADLTLLYLQNRESCDSGTVGGQPSVASAANAYGSQVFTSEAIGSILETTIQKSPLFYIEQKQIDKGIGRFRELLRAVESKSCKNLHRLILARQLAEVLLRGVCSETYPPITTTSAQYSKNKFKARCYDGFDKFVPNNEEEEALLLLLIAENMAVKEAVLERRPEHTQSRQHAFNNATAIYDLLAINLVRRGHSSMLSNSLEQAMKFSYEEFHVWYQFGLTLVQNGKPERAYSVLKECFRLKSTDPTIPLLLAKICYENTHKYDDGLSASESALKIATDAVTRSKAYMYIGLGCTLKSLECRVKEGREGLLSRASEAYTEAYNLDAYNVEAVYHLALHQAKQRHLSDAVIYVREALRLQADHMNALILYSLILSAEKKYEQAIEVLKFALCEHPDTLSLLLLRSKLESKMGNAQQALSTCASMLKLWKEKYQQETQLEEERGTGLIDRFTSTDNKSALLVSEVHLDSGSVRESLAASRIEKALSEVVSITNWGNSLWANQSQHNGWTIQAHIWLHLAEVYMEQGRYKEAYGCVQEACTIQPLSYLASYMKGRILECEERYAEARSSFEAALSINPYHVKSMVYLGKCHLLLDNLELSEKMLRDAVLTEPTSHQAWRELGLTLEASGDHDTAIDCFMSALNLERFSPIMPFNFVLHLT